VSKDGSKGGHVLNLSFDEAKLALDATDNFEMLLPDEEFFSSIDYSLDRSEEVRKAERND
jgi:alpha-acetolactate decarboxylase